MGEAQKVHLYFTEIDHSGEGGGDGRVAWAERRPLHIFLAGRRFDDEALTSVFLCLDQVVEHCRRGTRGPLVLE